MERPDLVEMVYSALTEEIEGALTPILNQNKYAQVVGNILWQTTEAHYRDAVKGKLAILAGKSPKFMDLCAEVVKESASQKIDDFMEKFHKKLKEKEGAANDDAQ